MNNTLYGPPSQPVTPAEVDAWWKEYREILANFLKIKEEHPDWSSAEIAIENGKQRSKNPELP